MKIFVLFERASFGDGDSILAVSTSKRKIKKEYNKEVEKMLKCGFIEGYKDDTEFVGNDEYGRSQYTLTIETHETIK